MAVEELPPSKLKPDPAIVTCDTFTVAVPVFVTLRLCVAELATETFPKLTLVELAVKTPDPAPPVAGCGFAALV